MLLFNPNEYSPLHVDAHTRAMVQKVIDHFEGRGRRKLKEDDRDRVWYRDFLDFQAREKIFANVLTPAAWADGDPNARWDTFRICQINEVLGFYGLSYWYTWQVSILGLGPIWMGHNDAIKRATAERLRAGGIFAFGLSEKEHGADIYTTDMRIRAGADGKAQATGSKYYIGNGNEAAFVSTFGQRDDTGDYAWFVAEPQHPAYALRKNVMASQNYVAEYALQDYPVDDANTISQGQHAWDSALNTINVGKFNLGWASIGICTHAFYEAIDHASSRRLFDRHVTDFKHIKQLFVDAYARLCAMKLFAARAADYMRVASAEDRRYLLFNPLVKMKVTTQGEEVINLLWDVIAAKGFEKDMYFEMAARDIRALPKLEGTVHVNMALIIKFMANYFFKPAPYPDLTTQWQPRDDSFLFQQGPTTGLGKIRFHDYRIAYGSVDLPNVRVFKQQIRIFKTLLLVARPTREQGEDFDFLLNLGELFTLVVYGQLIIENSKLYGIDDDLLDQIFDFIVRDFSKYALNLSAKTGTTRLQQGLLMTMLRRPVVDPKRFERVLRGHVYALRGAYCMNEEPAAGAGAAAAHSQGSAAGTGPSSTDKDVSVKRPRGKTAKKAKSGGGSRKPRSRAGVA